VSVIEPSYAGMANRQGKVDLRQLELWLGLVTEKGRLERGSIAVMCNGEIVAV